MSSIVAVGLGKGYYNSTSMQVELTRVPVTIRNLPSQLRGLKIGLLTDFHASLFVSDEIIKTSAQLIMSEKPDLIVTTGDYITRSSKPGSDSVGTFNNEYLIQCCAALSSLKAPLGIYGVLGNHDFWSGPEAVLTICDSLTRQTGMVWLRNRSIKLSHGGAPFYLLGVDDYWETSCSLAAACAHTNKDAIKILLSHNPDINEEVTRRQERIDLVLSGHTHGGQIVLPIIGQPVIPSKFGQKYREGLVRDGERQTYISRGVGCSIAPFRLNCMPEATVITLV